MNTTVRNRQDRPKSRSVKSPARRRGVTSVLIGFFIVVVIGIVAFTVDISHLMVAQAQMQRTADACALAATWEFANQLVDGADQETASFAVRKVAQQYAKLNPIGRQSPKLDLNGGNLEQGDIVVGHVSDFAARDLSLNTSTELSPNAVRIRVLRTDQRNGRVPYFFARIFGFDGQEMQASATAGFARNVQGFQLTEEQGNLPILPLILDADSWETLEGGEGRDDWSWNKQTLAVEPGSDGIPETNIFPKKKKDKRNSLKRGTVNIGGSGHDRVRISKQILQGISTRDLAYHGGYLRLGPEGRLKLKGNKGLGGAKRELQQIVGKRRIIPVFSELSGDDPSMLGPIGKEGDYTVVKWVGVRIMVVNLKGKNKYAIVQPARIVTSGMIPSPTPGTSDGLYTSGFLLR